MNTRAKASLAGIVTIVFGILYFANALALLCPLQFRASPLGMRFPAALFLLEPAICLVVAAGPPLLAVGLVSGIAAIRQGDGRRGWIGVGMCIFGVTITVAVCGLVRLVDGVPST